ncbi:MAG: hypothetical protein HY709_09925 [Candidatus Latescibacteria bacterium]|nr:hypothetical protein [Candidatus Latescibacterota bacterium]
MSFDNVIGQERAKRLLGSALKNGKLGQTLLIWGPSGSGKRALALELAKAVNCLTNPLDPCDVCSSCRKIRAWTHPDLLMILPCSHEVCRSPRRRRQEEGELQSGEEYNDASDYEAEDAELASSIARNPYRAPAPGRGEIISALKARGLRQRLGYRPREAKDKVALIFDAERMCPPFVSQPTAANILLKVLEEPPRDTFLILTATHPGTLLPTIVSRCQWIRLTPLSRAEIRNVLEQDAGNSKEAHRIAALADGDLRMAYQIASPDMADLDRIREETYTFLMTVLTGDPLKIFGTIERVTTGANQGERVKQMCIFMLVWLRDALLFVHGCHDRVVNLDRLSHLEGLIRHLSTASICRWIERIERGMEQLSRHVHPSLLLLSLAQRQGYEGSDYDR